MIYAASRTREEVIGAIPDHAKVIDVGGATAPYKRADSIIDIVPWEGIRVQDARGSSDVRFSKNTYIQHDICSREPWPIADKAFDYSICSHVLEDIRDPLWVCSELIRTSKAGYIEIPSKLYETTFGLEVKGLAGASHHRWVIDLLDGKIRFTFKYMHAHVRRVNRNRKKFNKSDPAMYLCLEWSDTFEFHENWLNSGKEIFEFYLDREISEGEKWAIYRDIQDRPFIVRWLAYMKNMRRAIDTDSYRAHNRNFMELHTPEHAREIISNYDADRNFEDGGYSSALARFSHRYIHVDIGTGIGWLLRKTSPLFERVIGIEPSEKAVQVSKEVLNEFDNVTFINKPMLEAFHDLPLDKPIFFTTSTVFSHISNHHVATFLKYLASVPHGSTFYFDENYDTNINHTLWRIRNKEWWAQQLPDWQLSFFANKNGEYLLGIYGEKVGKEHVTNSYSLSMPQKVQWYVHGILNLALKASNKIIGTKFQLIKFRT